MFQWLKHVIGQVMATMQPAGLVVQMEVSQIGGDSNIAEQPQPVKQERKRKPKVAKATTRVKSPTKETSPAPTRTKKSSASGIKRKTPVRQSQQHAKRQAKPKP